MALSDRGEAASSLSELVGCCPVCEGPPATFNRRTLVVECADCGRPWPESYWREQGER